MMVFISIAEISSQILIFNITKKLVLFPYTHIRFNNFLAELVIFLKGKRIKRLFFAINLDMSFGRL